jgi:hypothetical protein
MGPLPFIKTIRREGNGNDKKYKKYKKIILTRELIVARTYEIILALLTNRQVHDLGKPT